MLAHLPSFFVYVEKVPKDIPELGPFGHNDVNIFINNVKHESKQQPLKAEVVNISSHVVGDRRCMHTQSVPLYCASVAVTFKRIVTMTKKLD